MGVYINMDMPQSCDDCRLNNGISCYAVPEYTEDGVVGRTDDRPDWCPLVPVPKHGRLGDLDALIKAIAENMEAAKKADNYDWWNACSVAGDFVMDAPTIIPADGNLQSDRANANNSEVIANSKAEEGE